MLNKEMLLDAAQKTGGDTFDVVEHSGTLYYGVNVVKAIESTGEFRPHSMVELLLKDSPDPSIVGSFYSYAAYMHVPNTPGIDTASFTLTTNVIDPFNAHKILQVDSSNPLYYDFLEIRSELILMLGQLTTDATSFCTVSQDMTNIYVSIFATKEAIDQNNIVSTLKHKYPWGSPYQIPINGEQYWESTYNLIDEGGGG